MQVRIDPKQEKPLRHLAEANKRTVTREVEVSIDKHLQDHEARESLGIRDGDILTAAITKQPKKGRK